MRKIVKSANVNNVLDLNVTIATGHEYIPVFNCFGVIDDIGSYA